MHTCGVVVCCVLFFVVLALFVLPFGVRHVTPPRQRPHSDPHVVQTEEKVLAKGVSVDTYAEGLLRG